MSDPSGACAELELEGVVERLDGPNGPRAHFADEVAERRVEYEALVDLLLRQATAGVDPETRWVIARAVAAGCMGQQHLWRDMQLPDRATLRRIMETYFAPFSADNTMDMRWKKYIYRKLCRWGGFNTCKAPSCGVCPEYSSCFGDT